MPRENLSGQQLCIHKKRRSHTMKPLTKLSQTPEARELRATRRARRNGLVLHKTRRQFFEHGIEVMYWTNDVNNTMVDVFDNLDSVEDSFKESNNEET